MKTTIDIPDELFRNTKATAALEGQSLKDFVASALREKLARPSSCQGQPPESGWRSVLGKAHPEHVKELDEIIESELSRIELEGWR